MKILITGGCGFIGHHLVEAVLKTTDWEIIILDRLNYAANGFDRLRDIEAFDDRRVHIFTHDFIQPIVDGIAEEIGQVDFIIHMGAETHVDNSIVNPAPFVMSNVVGTMQMLEFARRQTKLQKFVYFSTDEVFGPAPEGVNYKEWDRYNCTNPYSASKAGGEELCLAYANCYQVPVIVSHTMNAFGERQHPEKFIPGTIRKILRFERVIIHANADKTRAGSRYYIHARNIASAVLFLLDHGQIREKYNIVGEKEVDNLQMAQSIARILDMPLECELVDFHSSRPGHDLRYALDGTRLAQMGFSFAKKFEGSLEKMVRWSIRPENIRWIGGA